MAERANDVSEDLLQDLLRFVPTSAAHADDHSIPTVARAASEAPAELLALLEGRLRVHPAGTAGESSSPQGVGTIKPVGLQVFKIIGSDLPPRTTDGQALRQVTFELRQLSPSRPITWILNRISDLSARAELVRMLNRYGQEFLEIPFDWDEWAGIVRHGPDPDLLRRDDHSPETLFREFAPHISYLFNVNGARNFAIDAAREDVSHVLPLDGGALLTTAAWNEVREAIHRQRDARDIVIPMARFANWSSVLHNLARDEPPLALLSYEPQVAVARELRHRFNLSAPYGRRSKVEYLWALGVPGPWDNWKSTAWDPPRRTFAASNPPYDVAGWALRLPLRTPADQAPAAGSDAELRRMSIVRALLFHIDALDQRHGPGSSLLNRASPGHPSIARHRPRPFDVSEPRPIRIEVTHHGLANRLRALHACAAIAEAINVPFGWTWEPNWACDPELSSILDVQTLPPSQEASAIHGLPMVVAHDTAPGCNWPIEAFLRSLPATWEVDHADVEARYRAWRARLAVAPAIVEAIDRYESYNPLSHTLAVHYRAGDNVSVRRRWQLEQVSREEVLVQAERYASKLSLDRIFLATDDDVLRIAAQHRGGAWTCSASQSWRHAIAPAMPPDYAARDWRRPTSVHQSVAELETLRRCPALLGTEKSSFSQLASELGAGNLRLLQPRSA